MTVPFSLFFRLTLFLLVLDALGALYLTGILEWPELLAVLLVTGGSWWADRLRAGLPGYRRIWDVLTVVFLVFAVLDLFLLAESFIVGVIHLLLFLQTYKLYNARTHRDLLDIFILTFLQLVAASTLTVSFGFLLAFCLYMVLGVWGLILFHLKREADIFAPERSRELLASSALLTPRFLLQSVAVALVSLLLTLAIFVVIPRIGRTYLPLKAQLGTLTTGFTDRVDLGAYGTIQNDPTIVMRISFPESPARPDRIPGLRWRGLAFDYFDGRTWSLRRPGRTPVRRILESYFPATPFRRAGPYLAYEVFLEPIGTEVIFGLPRIVTVQGRLGVVEADGGDGLNLPTMPSSPLRYVAVSQPERFDEADLRRRVSPDEYPREIREAYLQLPPLSPRLRDLAGALAAGAGSPYEVARRMESYLAANLQYSLDLRRTSDLDPLEEFLFHRKGGNCEYFAAGMTVLLRAEGIPARVVNGFQRGEWNEPGQYFAVRQRDAHSWVEVYFPGAGWVTFDPSPRAAFEAQTLVATGWAGQYLDALRMRWNRYVIDYNLRDQARLAMSLRQYSTRLRQNIGQSWRIWSLQASDAVRRLWRQYAYAAGVLLVLVAASVMLFRRTPSGSLATGWRLRAQGRQVPVVFYERMIRLLARRGCSRPASATAREFASTLADRPHLYAPVAELTALYEQVRFGGESFTPAHQRRAAALLREVAVAVADPRR